LVLIFMFGFDFHSYLITITHWMMIWADTPSKCATSFNLNIDKKMTLDFKIIRITQNLWREEKVKRLKPEATIL